jgi:hypothetical protein
MAIRVAAALVVVVILASSLTRNVSSNLEPVLDPERTLSIG